MASSTTIRVDTLLHKRLKSRADQEGRKLKTFLEKILIEALKRPMEGK
jgi:predicted HicB family RNase H-like nuclease